MQERYERKEGPKWSCWLDTKRSCIYTVDSDEGSYGLEIDVHKLANRESWRWCDGLVYGEWLIIMRCDAVRVPGKVPYLEI